MCPNQAGSSSSGGKHDGKKSGDPTGSPDNLCLFAEQPLGLSLSRTRVNWFCDLPYRHKIFICGNHDVCLYGADIDGLDDNVHYLCNSGIEIDGLKFYGVPMFMGDCISDRQSRNYAKIPSDTDILITHSPAYGILDLDDNINYGSEEILDRLTALNLKAHLFGHIHAQHGMKSLNGTIFSNGAIMNSDYTNLLPFNVIAV